MAATLAARLKSLNPDFKGSVEVVSIQEVVIRGDGLGTRLRLRGAPAKAIQPRTTRRAASGDRRAPAPTLA